MELAQVVNQENCNAPFVCKFLEQADLLIVICVQITVTARAPNTLQRVNHNQFCIGMFGQELLNLLFQAVLERVRHDRKVQRWRRIFRQVKEPRLDTLERIFKAEVQNFTLGCCEIPERLPLRNAQTQPQRQPRLADFRRAREDVQALWNKLILYKGGARTWAF